ncbi:hypothetical protein KAR52_01610 [Candidatus Pacearchaeota archaeon]|nr:hypothetical protein [Candidatus Pacearchaeota archaeon]
MEEVVNNVGKGILEIYDSFLSMLPPRAQIFINLFLLIFLVVIYSIFVWKFYRFISKKNILGLNLNKYNKSQHPLITKLFAGLLYFLEYIIILPFLLFFWFSIFTIFLILLTTDLDIQTLLIISATVIAAIRITSYIPKYGEKLSRELAKLLPFTLLAISLLNPGFFDISRIFAHFSLLPGFFEEIIYYLIFIIIFEIILRFFDFIFSLFELEEVTVEGDEEDNSEDN